MRRTSFCEPAPLSSSLRTSVAPTGFERLKNRRAGGACSPRAAPPPPAPSDAACAPSATSVSRI